jgi:hypothetical protein
MTTVALCVLDAIVMKRDDAHGIDERSHKFFVEVLAFIETIPLGPKPTNWSSSWQLVRDQLAAIVRRPLAAHREKSSSGSMRSHCEGQTNQCGGCEPARREISVRGSNVLRCWMRDANWRESSGRLS